MILRKIYKNFRIVFYKKAEYLKQYYRLMNIKYYKMKSIVISYVINNEIKYIYLFKNVKLSYKH